MAEDLTDRQAADAVRLRLDWKYALGMSLDDPGSTPRCCARSWPGWSSTVCKEAVLDALLAALKEKGLVEARGKQRTDSQPM